MGRAQAGMEYMMVVGFTVLLALPLMSIYGAERDLLNDQVNMRQAKNIQREIVDAANTVYYLGKPAKTTLKIYMPDDVLNIVFVQNYIVFAIELKRGGSSEVPPDYADVNITGNISTKPGIQFIEIVADDYQVNVSTRGG